jgi:hypothetical protein
MADGSAFPRTSHAFKGSVITGRIQSHAEDATPHEHRIAFRLGVWQVRQWQQEAQTARRSPKVSFGFEQ